MASAAGLAGLGLARADAVAVAGLAHCAADLTTPPPELTELGTCRRAASRAMAMAGIGIQAAGVCEVHDCFTISGLLSLEALFYV